MILVITTDTPPEHLGQLEILGVASTTVDIPQERPMFKSNRWTSVPFDHLDDHLASSASANRTALSHGRIN